MDSIWNQMMVLVELVNDTFGTDPQSFLVVSIAVGILLAFVRSILKDQEWTQAKWYKPALTGASLVLGVGAAFLAWSTVLYATVPNAATIIFLGVFNGFVAMGLWQLVKYIPKISEWVTGTPRVELPETLKPSPAKEDKPEDDKDDAPEITEDEDAADDEGGDDTNTPAAEDADER